MEHVIYYVIGFGVVLLLAGFGWLFYLVSSVVGKIFFPNSGDDQNSLGVLVTFCVALMLILTYILGRGLSVMFALYTP
jgi:hypothetical protein